MRTAIKIINCKSCLMVNLDEHKCSNAMAITNWSINLTQCLFFHSLRRCCFFASLQIWAFLALCMCSHVTAAAPHLQLTVIINCLYKSHQDEMFVESIMRNINICETSRKQRWLDKQVDEDVRVGEGDGKLDWKIYSDLFCNI